MEFVKSKLWLSIKVVYWTLVFAAAGFFYWLIFTTLL